MEFTKKVIFEEFHNKKYNKLLKEHKAIPTAINFIQENVAYEINEEGKKALEGQLRYLLNLYIKEIEKQKSFQRLESVFKNDWNLTCITVLDEWLIYPELESSHISLASTSKKSGRPSKKGIDVSRTTEYEIANKIVSMISNNYKIAFLAVRIAAKKYADKHIADLANLIVHEYNDIEHYNFVDSRVTKKPTMMSAEESLAFLLENNLSKQVYKNIRKKCYEKKAPVFPSYEKIAAAKKECRPTVMYYEDQKASTTYMSLFEHTTTRLIETEIENIKNALEETNSDTDVVMKTSEVSISLSESDDESSDSETGNVIKANLIFGDGGDSSTGYSHFHQKTATGEVIDDHSLFVWTINPIMLQTDDGKVLWKNPIPNSPFSCRPVLLEFAKETKEYVEEVYKKFKQEKEELEPITLHINNIPIIITPKFHTTLIDGKVFNIITETSSQSCPVCEAKPKDFLKRENCKSTEEGLLHGCQSLHAIVNVFNFLLKLAYRMDNLKWQARGQKEKDSVAERKFQIQERLKRAFGITFDCPRSGGFGNTTTGNLCRRAFAEPKLLSEALYLDVDLVTNLSVILAVLNCKEEIDIDKLDILCKETLKFFEKGGQYNWAQISPTVHKILLHSREIIMMLPLSPGYFSEESCESNHKHLKQYRLSRSRKSSLKNSITDIYNRAMDASDPVVFASSVVARQLKRKQRPIPQQVLQYLKNKEIEEDVDEGFSVNPTYADNFCDELDDCTFDLNFDENDADAD